MRNLLFLGANSDQLPYMDAAKRADFRVVATDMNPDAPGKARADAWYTASYEDGPALIEIGEGEGFGREDAVFTAASQFAYLGASRFAAHFGIPFVPYESVYACLDKSALYPLFERFALPVPQWRLFEGERTLLAAREEYGTVYLKSDFGKSPNYCFRIAADAVVPALPASFDRYYRKSFIVQKEVRGTHYRVDWVAGRLYTFRKETDEIAYPAPDFSFGALHEAVDRMLTSLGLSQHLVKFDVIDSGEELFFIDIGLEPPSRMCAYLSHLGYDFPALYLTHLVEGRASYPDPHTLARDVVIRGTKATAI